MNILRCLFLLREHTFSPVNLKILGVGIVYGSFLIFFLSMAVWQYLHLGHGNLSCQMRKLQRKGNAVFLRFAVDLSWIKFRFRACAMQSQSYDSRVHSWLSTAQKSCITCFWEEQAINSYHRHHRVLGQEVCACTTSWIMCTSVLHFHVFDLSPCSLEDICPAEH